MSDIDDLVERIRRDAQRTRVAEDAAKIVRPEEYDWYRRELVQLHRRMGGPEER